MAIEIKVPSIGESITEVIVSKWLKAKGSQVRKDEVIVSLETDKVNVDVPSPVDGILVELRQQEQGIAKVGECIAVVEEGAALPASASSPAAPASSPAPATSTSLATAPSQSTSPGHVMPAAARMLAETAIAAANVVATGPGGRLLKEDVQRAATLPATVAATPSPAMAALPTDIADEIVPMTPLRRRVAERLLEAQQTAAILTTFNEVDMTEVMALRKAYQEQFTKRYGTKLGFMSFFVKACIDALRLVPEMNAEIRGMNIVYHHTYDIGVAVGGAKGLVVPVLRRAECMGFAQIEQAITAYAQKAQQGKLTLDEMQGGTFTISNGGIYGSLLSTPILNPPQSGILGMHNIVDRPIGLNGQIVLRPMMYLAVSYDHRIIDGRGAVTFLRRIKDCLEQPSRMVLEI